MDRRRGGLRRDADGGARAGRRGRRRGRDGGPRRNRNPAPRRKRHRCGRGRRLRPGGHLAGGRQHRRRRILDFARSEGQGADHRFPRARPPRRPPRHVRAAAVEGAASGFPDLGTSRLGRSGFRRGPRDGAPQGRKAPLEDARRAGGPARAGRLHGDGKHSPVDRGASGGALRGSGDRRDLRARRCSAGGRGAPAAAGAGADPANDRGSGRRRLLPRQRRAGDREGAEAFRRPHHPRRSRPLRGEGAAAARLRDGRGQGLHDGRAFLGPGPRADGVDGPGARARSAPAARRRRGAPDRRDRKAGLFRPEPVPRGSGLRRRSPEPVHLAGSRAAPRGDDRSRAGDAGGDPRRDGAARRLHDTLLRGGRRRKRRRRDDDVERLLRQRAASPRGSASCGTTRWTISRRGRESPTSTGSSRGSSTRSRPASGCFPRSAPSSR